MRKTGFQPTWSEEDKARLRELHAMDKRPKTAVMAKRLGRTVGSVRGMLCHLGLAEPRELKGGLLSRRVAELVAQGLTDREVAGRIGRAVSVAWTLRARQGLPRNPSPIGRPRGTFKTRAPKFVRRGS